MRIKTQFNEFDFKYEDAEFRLKEADITQFARSIFTSENKVEINTNDALNRTVDACIVSWKNIIDEEGNDLPCTDINKQKLPSELKLKIFSEVQKRSALKPEKKSS